MRGTIAEVIALENEIQRALPAADAAAGTLEPDAPLVRAVIGAHAILCNAWNGPGERLASLRTVAAELRPFL